MPTGDPNGDGMLATIAGATLHTCPALGAQDELAIRVANLDNAPHLLTVQSSVFGTNYIVEYSVPAHALPNAPILPWIGGSDAEAIVCYSDDDTSLVILASGYHHPKGSEMVEHRLFSEGPNGRPIKIASANYTKIHVAEAGDGKAEALYLYAASTTGTPTTLSIWIGSHDNPDEALNLQVVTNEILVGGEQPTLLIEGYAINEGRFVWAKAADADVAVVYGYVIWGKT